ncbi:C2H2-type domain-containing protein [Caenorhabditis elegans]|uniref:C2H2-type domain-containing protein n=2 Tax=Caenorhabditis elegans TaxID=6239 RepID=A0A0M7REP1_CAEEL|nr:C2H2-type domain-containing protein [Caenorhabditis elegans]CUR30024.1 C2H2-type domain-containing protein [Caenorhabditis elegans]|eukprot:NP_001303725.1 Uncharacterized protein CELE_F37B4.10 [Caenorhabditis elegans]
MSSSSQNIKCGWNGCGDKFSSELDMNMHVMMNHLMILEYGEFVMNRRAVNRKRARELAREESMEITSESLHNPNALRAVKREPVLEVREVEVPTVNVAPVPARLPDFCPPARVPEHLQLNGFEDQQRDHESLQIKANIMPVSMPSTADGPLNRFSPDLVENDAGSDSSLQNGNDQAQFDAQEYQNQTAVTPLKLIEIIDEFLDRLKPMKQLGFVRPHKPVYCIVCLKYQKSFHTCNWKHTPGEDRVAEMWYRRFGKERPNGKTQLMKELCDIRQWIIQEGGLGTFQ